MGTAPKLASTLFACTIWEPFELIAVAHSRDALQGSPSGETRAVFTGASWSPDSRRTPPRGLVVVRRANCSQVSSQDGPGAAIDTACLDMV